MKGLKEREKMSEMAITKARKGRKHKMILETKIME